MLSPSERQIVILRLERGVLLLRILRLCLLLRTLRLRGLRISRLRLSRSLLRVSARCPLLRTRPRLGYLQLDVLLAALLLRPPSSYLLLLPVDEAVTFEVRLAVVWVVDVLVSVDKEGPLSLV